jgi:hypothetical protein
MSVAHGARALLPGPAPPREWTALLWRLLWLVPLLWPVLITVQAVWWLCAAAGRSGRHYTRKYSTKDANLLTEHGKLPTEGAVALAVLLAGLILQLGELLGELLGALLRRRESKRVARARKYEERRAKAAGEEESFHTPPSSPPPFDLLSPEAGMDAKSDDGADEQRGVPAPTLRERLRGAATAMNVMRRIGVAGIWERRDTSVPASQQADLAQIHKTSVT